MATDTVSRKATTRRYERKGYTVRAEDGEIYFCPAGDLLDLKGRQRHLQLVQPAAKTRRQPLKATHA
ncbi:hypothetical protein [Variovorax soli]|uniref:Uncharacterized protein n=1 Tax=Variovorax soli TaxID=376815 RepID=A0ABU1NC19_9BURK|nr:hypothetical protein [Variovorax soli]MDR6535586.1 hypothetical protein [Variovorax soli]